MTRLRTLAKPCKFHDDDFEIKMQIVYNGKSARLRRKALLEPDYKLSDMLIDGRKAEMSSAQASGMEESFQELHVKEIRTENTCYKCGFSYPHRNKPCPAKHAVCSYVASLDILQNFVVRNNKRPRGNPYNVKSHKRQHGKKEKVKFHKRKNVDREKPILVHGITRISQALLMMNIPMQSKDKINFPQKHN